MAVRNIDRRNLEKLLEKLVNKRKYECPDCERKPYWQLMEKTPGDLPDSMNYCCSNCKGEHQYFELFMYNIGRDK